ncbi:MAG TPA: protease inhibitor I42 family protein [Actinophytocola sp.]|jgi:predicted secreted protein|uniref:protease inhibitor I42 family protein n=1 Tax=Actinophytocola sp. TaxID=1872138 RepID=UPI002F95DB74
MRVVAVVVGLVLLVTSCSVTRTGEARTGERRDALFTIDDEQVRVEAGMFFAIAVDDNASVGDMWSVSEEPDPDVVDARGDHYESESDEDVVGGGGTRFFEFQALREGTTSLELRNCFRGCADPDDDHRYRIDVEVS